MTNTIWAVPTNRKTHYAIWREGEFHEPLHTTWRLRVAVEIARHTVKNLVCPGSARRVRIAHCAGGQPDPVRIEARLRRIGAIAPPGGWARETWFDHVPPADVEVVDVRISTLSVLLIDMT